MVKTKETWKTIDGNEAVAYVAYRTNEVICIYPITPASSMGEWADEWSIQRIPNIWNTVPTVIEMQSEGGAAGALHGCLQTGSLSTTFTSSQGLLLMIPNMYKIAGELLPAVLHVAARSIAAQGLSIFGDHSDVMATRSTGFAMLASGTVQEAHDFALISQAASLLARLPFLHFFDGFRTSHEVAKIKIIADETMRMMIADNHVSAMRRRALTPENPSIRGTAQNPDVYFQARESVNPYYDRLSTIVQNMMDRFAEIEGRAYKIYEYFGDPGAERVIVVMGSGGETVHETVEYLLARGEKVGVVKVRLYRPFDQKMFMNALPKSVRAIAVLDRTKEPGSYGEPLYLDCLNALNRARQSGSWSNKNIVIVGGRFGLSSKEFTPAMVKAVLDNLETEQAKNDFTVGITDDLCKSHLEFDPTYSIESKDVTRALFYGLGSDGTVGANKNTIKIIGQKTDNYVQGYFVYDSKKAGAMTVSHLRISKRPIRSTYLITWANFIACHQPQFLERFDILDKAVKRGVFLLNTPNPADRAFAALPVEYQRKIIEKELRFFIIDATKVAKDCGLGGRINTVMQVAAFAITDILPTDVAIEEINDSIKKTYGRKGQTVVEQNLKAVSMSLAEVIEVKVPPVPVGGITIKKMDLEGASEFVKKVTAKLIAGHGDDLPVSALPDDGTYPVGTTKWEKRNLALEIPEWTSEFCIQCSKCAMVCPHAAIRHKVYDPSLLSNSPENFSHKETKEKDWKGLNYTIQVAPEDCTGCSLCAEVCPGRDKNDKTRKALMMVDKDLGFEREQANWRFFLELPEYDRDLLKTDVVRQQQVQQPLFEFSGACAGCGETPYLKLLSQLFGDRMVVANATGCSSIFGGNLPTTPWSVNREGRGPAWANSLFEDNAEFGFGFRVSIDKQKVMAQELLRSLSAELGDRLVAEILFSAQTDEAEIHKQRDRVADLKAKLIQRRDPVASRLLAVADYLVEKCVWIVGGDGWAYDIGYGGLDHVLASGKNVNILVLDTEVYSNTGGQASKASPLGAVAKFAMGGKQLPKKDLGLLAMTYGNVYVAQVALGAKDTHTLRTLLEAERYPGPSLVIAYAHCIAHGIDMSKGMEHQKAAVASGQWLLYRYNPENIEQRKAALTLDTTELTIPVDEYLKLETRFTMLQKSNPEHANEVFAKIRQNVINRHKFYRYLASWVPEN